MVAVAEGDQLINCINRDLSCSPVHRFFCFVNQILGNERVVEVGFLQKQLSDSGLMHCERLLPFFSAARIYFFPEIPAWINSSLLENRRVIKRSKAWISAELA